MRPTVAVLIPVHNARPWISHAIDSVLSQCRPADEVVVLDDGSTDGSVEAISRFRNQVRLERSAHSGQNAARNRLTASTRAEWVVYLDADDELAPGSLAGKIDRVDGADVVYGSMETTVFLNGIRMRSSLREPDPHEDPWVTAFQWRLPNTSAFMFKRSAVLRAGQWNESLRVCTDYDLYFRLLLSNAVFAAAPLSRSLYRHWSPEQAAHRDPVVRVATRVRLMQCAAEQLRERGQLTAARIQAFEQSMWECIRSLYHFDAGLTRDAAQALRTWNAASTPDTDHFPALYVVAFRLGGLAFAEALASVFRNLPGVAQRRRQSPVDYDSVSILRRREQSSE